MRFLKAAKFCKMSRIFFFHLGSNSLNLKHVIKRFITVFTSIQRLYKIFPGVIHTYDIFMVTLYLNLLLLFSHLVVSDSLQPHGLQDARPAHPHHLLKFAQVHIYCISDTIQPCHLLMSSSPFALSLSQHQGLFQQVGCSHQVAKKLKL